MFALVVSRGEEGDYSEERDQWYADSYCAANGDFGGAAEAGWG